MSHLEPDVARWLTTTDGLRSVDFATSRLDRGEDELAVVTAVRRHVGDTSRTSAAVAAAFARIRARSRFRAADRLLFTRSTLEQTSDPLVSAWRSRRFEHGDVHDLCCGVGGDTAALVTRARHVHAVDLDPAHVTLLEHNLVVQDLTATTAVGDALQVTVPDDALVHADPARRVQGRRITDPSSTRPPVDRLLRAVAHAAGAGVVVAPGTDADHPALPGDVEVEYLQVGEDLTEAIVWAGALRASGVTASATVLDHGRGVTGGGPLGPGELAGATSHHLARYGPRPERLPVGAVGDHLVEVAPAAVRARLHDDVGRSIGAWRVARRRALLTVTGSPPPSPWYRARPVLEVLAARPRVVRSWLAASDPGAVELVLHGVDADPHRWWRELGRPPRGPQGIRIELVRLDEGSVAVVTRSADEGRGW